MNFKGLSDTYGSGDFTRESFMSFSARLELRI